MESILKWNVILVGESGVGKTSMCARFAKNAFTGKYSTTIVVDRFSKRTELHDTQIDLQIWGTAGKDCFRSLLPEYFRLADGCIMVYDMKSANTFYALSDWFSEFRSSNESAPVIVVGNKSDNATCEVVSQDVIASFPSHENMEFMQCSAKTGENVDKVFVFLIEKIWENIHHESVLHSARQENAPVHQKFEKTNSSTDEKSDKYKHCIMSNEENNSSIKDKSEKSRQSHEENSPLHQISENNDSFIPEKSEENSFVLRNSKNLTESKVLNEENFFIHKGSEESDSVHQKSVENNSSFYENSGNSIMINDNKSSLQNKSDKPRKFLLLDEENSSFHQVSEESDFFIHEKSEESSHVLQKLKKLTESIEENFSIYKKSTENNSVHQKSTENNSSIHEKYGKCRNSTAASEDNASIKRESEKSMKHILLNRETPSLHQESIKNGSPIHGEYEGNFLDHQISQKLTESVMPNANNFPIYEKSNVSNIHFHQKSTEHGESMMLNKDNSFIKERSRENITPENMLKKEMRSIEKTFEKNNSFVYEKSRETNLPFHRTTNECKEYIMLKTENSSVHQKSDENILSEHEKPEKTNFPFHEKSEKSNSFVDKISDKQKKCVMLNKSDSSTHEKSEKNDYHTHMKCDKIMKSFTSNENSSVHHKAEESSLYTLETSGKHEVSMTLNEKISLKPMKSIMSNKQNGSVDALAFIQVVTLGSKRIRKLPILKLS